MNTSQLPVRTRRDDASFQDAMAAHLRQSPAFFVSVAAHLVLMLLLWILAPAERDEHPAPQVTLQHAEAREVVQQTPPDEPEVEPEVDPVVTPVQDTVLVQRLQPFEVVAEQNQDLGNFHALFPLAFF